MPDTIPTQSPARVLDSPAAGSAWSLRAKVLATAFVATHVPLIATVLFVLTTPRVLSRAVVITVVLVSTLLGTAAVLWVLTRLLRPLSLASEALRAFTVRGGAPALPDARADEVGLLLARVSSALQRMTDHTRVLESQAHRDHLTGLLNRRAAESQLQYALALMERSEVPMCLVLLDVDRFKSVNDTLGHVEGDRVLVAIAETLRQHARRKVDWAARWGGDELLLALYTDLEGSRPILEQIRADVESGRFSGGSVEVTVSIGVTQCRPGEPVDQCLDRADRALYAAKQEGRNRVAAEA